MTPLSSLRAPANPGRSARPQGDAAGLSFHDLACERGGQALFGAFDLTLAPGTWLHVRGANGRGKTSFLRIACGLLAPTEGEVRWRGRSIARDRAAHARALTFVGDAPALKDALSAAENLAAAAAIAGRPCAARDVQNALAEAGLAAAGHVPARHLSLGQRRRAGLARLALPAAEGAGLWVLDEPFNALDDAGTAWLSGRLERHLEDGGIALLTGHGPVTLDARFPRHELAL